MKLTVTTTPQAIDPFAEQGPMTIVNEGPWTIYIDQDSSISEGQSLAIPPTESYVWDGYQAIWLVCAGGINSSNQSRVTKTRNSSLVTATRAQSNTVIATRRFSMSGAGIQVLATYESSAYKTLYVTVYTSEDGNGITVGEWQGVIIRWKDVNGEDIGQDEYRSNYGVTGLAGTLFTIPVRGAQFQIQYQSSAASYTVDKMEIRGTSVALRDRVDWLDGSAAVQENNPNSRGTSTGYFHLTPLVYGSPADSIYLNGLGNLITVCLRVSGPVTDAGRMYVRSLHNPSIIYADIVIPVVTSAQTVSSDITIPVGEPVEIFFADVPTSVSASHLSIVWKDYNG